MRDDELMDLQIETLFVLDEADRMRCLNQPGQSDASRVFLGRSPAGNRCIVRADLPDALAQELLTVASREPVVAQLESPRATSTALREALERYAPVTAEYCGPAWVLPPLDFDDADVAMLGPGDDARIERDFADWLPDLDPLRPFAALLVDGHAVSVCCSARNGLRAAEASLHTAEHARGRGYAQRVTRAWAHHVQQEGRTALYSTSWDNDASRHIAASLGGRLYAEDFHLT